MSRIFEAVTRSRAIQVVLYVLVWTALGMISATQSLMIYAARGDQAPLGLVVRFALPTWYAWAILAPLIYLAARRLPLDREHRARNVVAHLLLNGVVLVLAVLLVSVVRRVFAVPASRDLQVEMIGSINTALFTYWIIVLVAHAVGYYRETRAAERRTSELSAQLSRARLEALRAQLHPHFLFNTMNAISAFVREEPEKAEAMLAELAELLRLSIEGSADPLVPLARELEFVNRYLSIQQTRLGDRFELEMDIDPDMASVPVPTLILQPLVENAVEHGIARRLGPGRLSVRITRLNGDLCMDVSNDGPPVSEEELVPDGWRVGLRNTDDRLTQLYGSDRLRLSPRPEGGVSVRVLIPIDPTESN